MSSYKYYDYLKNYNSHFLNKYESWNHHHWGRKTNFLQLLNYRAYSLMTGRPILLQGIKIKGWFYMYGTLLCIMDVWGIWWFQEMHNKYSPNKWVYYQPYLRPEMTFVEDINITDTMEEKKPFTRLRYADSYKIVYGGKEEQDAVGVRRFRYR